MRSYVPAILSLTVSLCLVLAWTPGADASNFGTKPSENIQPIDFENTEPGTLTGIAYGGSTSGELPWGAPKAALLIEVLNEDGQWMAATTTGNDGTYTLHGLSEGTYHITATDTDGAAVEYSIDVASGTPTVLNFMADERRDDSLVASPAAVLVEEGAASPDTSANGKVDLQDLQFVRDNLNRPVEDAYRDIDADLNDDGQIDTQDVDIVRAAFGRSVLSSTTVISSTVLPGGSVCDLEGTQITSLDGHTNGTLTQVGPDTVRLTVTQDVGMASSDLTGTITFTNNPDTPSWIDVSLTDGRILGGEVGLILSGGVFEEPSTALGSVATGYVAFGPGGFENYRLVEVTGTLNYAGTKVAYKCDEGNEKKKNVACATVNAARGDAACNLGGVKCKTLNARCAQGGRCGRCSQASAAGLFRNPVTGRWEQGVKCQGCGCL